jgi:hypothetical protein
VKRYAFSVPHHVVEKLTPKERFVYYELCRLAATEPTKDEYFGIPLDPGSLITSHYRLSKLVDYAYSLTAITMDNLVHKDLIQLLPIEHEDYQSYYLVRIKDFDQGRKIRPEERLFPF